MHFILDYISHRNLEKKNQFHNNEFQQFALKDFINFILVGKWRAKKVTVVH